jgi:hypothetical protein
MTPFLENYIYSSLQELYLIRAKGAIINADEDG